MQLLILLTKGKETLFKSKATAVNNKLMLTIKSRILILASIFSFSLHVQSQISGNTFNKRINVPAKVIRVDSLLRIFARQTGVEFSFNSNKISPAKKISVVNHTQTLNQWLNTLNQTLGIQHKVVGNHIILIDIDKSVTSKPVSNAPTKKDASLSSIGGTVVVATKESAVEPGVEKTQNGSGKTSESSNAKADINQQKAGADINSSKTATDLVKQEELLLKSQVIELKTASIQLPIEGSPEEKSQNRSISFVGGYARHGSGDMPGMVFGGDYTVYYSKKFSVTYNFRGGIHTSKDAILYNNGGSGYTDASIRFTTAGFQLGANGGFSLVNSTHHEFMVKLGAFGRYQSASNGSDGYSISYPPPTTGLPPVVVAYDNRTPQETIAFGGILQFQYNFTFKSNVFLGIQPAFQTDTNGDAILQGSLAIGKRF